MMGESPCSLELRYDFGHGEALRARGRHAGRQPISAGV